MADLLRTRYELEHAILGCRDLSTATALYRTYAQVIDQLPENEQTGAMICPVERALMECQGEEWTAATLLAKPPASELALVADDVDEAARIQLAVEDRRSGRFDDPLRRSLPRALDKYAPRRR